jgi:tetratricopeptide (TPR) repeat protein
MQSKLRLLVASVLLASSAMLPAKASQSQEADPYADLRIEQASPSGSYLAGRYASRKRDTAIAARYIARALENDPNNPLLIERAFTLEVSSGNVEAAERFASRVLEFNDQHRLSLLVLGIRAVRQGKYAVAREYFRKVRLYADWRTHICAAVGLVICCREQPAGAMAELDSLKRNQAFENFRLFHAGLMADLTGDTTKAEANYRQAYDKAGTSLRVVQAYGSFLERTGRADEALAAYELFLRATQNNPLIEAARDRLKAGGEPAPFVQDAQAGIAEALYSIAGALTDERSIDIALVYARLALSVHPIFRKARRCLAKSTTT